MDQSEGIDEQKEISKIRRSKCYFVVSNIFGVVKIVIVNKLKISSVKTKVIKT